MKIIEVQTQLEVLPKQQEIQAKIDAYKAAQAYQLEHGGPGPVADYDIMSIVNEHEEQFQIISKEVIIIES